MPESRQHPRKVIHPPVAFQTAGGARIDALCHDISLGGMFIETATPATFGSEVTVFLTLRGMKQEAVVKGVVRWTKPTGMGVQFAMMGARETHALTEMLKNG